MLNSSLGQLEIDHRLNLKDKKIGSRYDCHTSNDQNIIEGRCIKQSDSPKAHSIEDQSKTACTRV